uniref:Putative radical SAM superfamily protein n=1 Tax=viral metagenome TaxID=1070528 RepID=A0A6M3KT30_9ZZZZ
MKMVLIIPPSPWLLSDRVFPFYGILYVSAYLKRHSDCEIAVCDLSGLEEKDWYIPLGDMYGVTGATPNFVYMKAIIAKLKAREPDKPVIVGGVHATVYPASILERTLADACVIGEGERTALQIVNGVSWKNIPGIVTREFNTGPPDLIADIDTLPLPDLKAIDYYSYLESSVPDYHNYLSPGTKREGSVILSRGCYFNCAFCCSRKLHNGRVRTRSPEVVVEELSYLKHEFGVEVVNVFDDTFAMSKKRAHRICELLVEKKVGMKWYCLLRADEVDLDLLLAMKGAGCLSISVGFETGSNRILKLMNKKTNIAASRSCIETAYKAGLMIYGFLIVGFPTETEHDVELTADFIRDNPEVDTWGLHTFQPYPGCDVWERPEKYGIEVDKNTDFSDYITIGNHKGLYSTDPVIDRQFRYLKEVMGNKSRELRK